MYSSQTLTISIIQAFQIKYVSNFIVLRLWRDSDGKLIEGQEAWSTVILDERNGSGCAENLQTLRFHSSL